MKTFYATFGYGQPNFPGYVSIYAPDENTARQMMVEEYDNRYCQMLHDESEIFPEDKVFRGELRYSQVSGQAMRIQCEVCHKMRLEHDIVTFTAHVPVLQHDVTLHVNHCRDTESCYHGATEKAVNDAEKMMSVLRDEH